MKRQSKTFQLKSNASQLRHEQFDGRDHLVAPVVCVVEGVLNGYLLPFEEIQQFVPAWNGVPLPVNHPTLNGQPVSANDPKLLETENVGWLFNVQVDAAAKSLKGELWIDVEKAKVHKDGPEIMQRLEGGQALEISTAYFSDIEETEGVWGGEQYYGIQRNLRPDHLALLPHTKGACNWSDGCGAPRLNSEVTEKKTKSRDELKSLVLALATNESVDLMELVTAAVDDKFEVRAKQETITMKNELIQKLIDNQGTMWKETHRATLETLSECDLKAMVEEADKKAAPAAPAANAQPPAQPAAQPAAPAAPAPAANAGPAKEQTVDEYLASVPAPLRNAMRAQLDAEKSQKAKLIAALKANKRCMFTEDQMNSMDIAMLENLGLTLNVSFEGMAPPRVQRARVDVNDDAPPAPPKVLTAPVQAAS